MYANLLVAIALSAQLGSVEDEGRERGGPPAERIANQLREQAARIERLEGEVRRLHETLERVGRLGPDRDESPRTADRSPEARVREMERTLALLRERARRGDADPETKLLEWRRQRGLQETTRQLEQFRTKRAEEKRNYEQQRAHVTREMQQAIERLEQGFKQADQGMERAIAELERRLVRLRGEGEERSERR